MSDKIRQIQSHGQSIWMDYISRDMLTSGELVRLIYKGVTGVTSNPTIFEKAISGSTDYDEDLAALAKQNSDTVAVYESLTLADIRTAADLLRPVYSKTQGCDGFVSLEVNPALAHNTEGTIEEAKRLSAELDRPNVMIKVPGTEEGMPAIQHLISQGINVNVTLIFSLDAYAKVREAYIAGLEERSQAGYPIDRVASVASFFVSRVDTAVDALVEQSNGPKDLFGSTAVANAKLAYDAFQQTFRTERFDRLRAQGAQTQRPLWASTSTKNPQYSDLLYVEPLIGQHTVNTMPPATFEAFLDHGKVAPTLEDGIEEAHKTMQSLQHLNIDLTSVTDVLLSEGTAAFRGSYEKLLTNIDSKIKALSIPARR